MVTVSLLDPRATAFQVRPWFGPRSGSMANALPET
jgi:hypothetical protein